jgi:CheY-like chemotaxis protein
MTALPSPPLSVLIVDDEPDMMQSQALLVSLWGHRPLLARDGPEALRLARAQRPDVALLDLGLPGMDGCALAQKLRAEPGLEGVRLVAVTGYGDERHRRLALEAGFDLVLIKPVETEVLQRLLEAGAARRPPLGPEELARLLPSLTAAAEVVEALGEPAPLTGSGWGLVGWSYEFVPWGVRFLRREGGRVTAAVVALALPEGWRAAVGPGYAAAPWPTTLMLLG